MSGIVTGWSKPPKHVGILIDRSIDHRLAREVSKIPFITARGLDDVYCGDPRPSVPDSEWLAEAGQRGWMVWTQNPQIWFVDHERAAIISNRTHVFCLGSAQLVGAGKAFAYGRWWVSMYRRHRRPDPCFWRLYPDRTLKNHP